MLLAFGVIFVVLALVAELNLFGRGERWRNRANRYYDRNATPERRVKNTKRWVRTYRLMGLLGIFLILLNL